MKCLRCRLFYYRSELIFKELYIICLLQHLVRSYPTLCEHSHYFLIIFYKYLYIFKPRVFLISFSKWNTESFGGKKSRLESWEKLRSHAVEMICWFVLTPTVTSPLLTTTTDVSNDDNGNSFYLHRLLHITSLSLTYFWFS